MIEELREASVSRDGIRFNRHGNESHRKDMEAYGGRDHPIVFINGKAVPWEDMDEFRISTTGFLPKLSIIFRDSYELFSSDLAIKNGDLVSVYIRPPSGDVRFIRTDFYILSSKPQGSEETVFYLRGILHVPLLWAEECRAYEGSSFQALDDLSASLDLGFSSNIRSTDDSMTWINSYQSRKDFIRDVTQHAYAGEESFFTSFIDLYYSLNLVEVNRELPPSGEFLTGDDLERTVHSMGKDTAETATILHNSTVKTEFSSNAFDNSFLVDESGELSLLSGYKKVIQYYSEDDRRKLEFNLDPLVTSGNEDAFLMKGRQGNEYYKELRKYKYRGNEFNRGGNVHPNYRFAEMLNYQNNEELEKLKLVVDLERVNLSIYKYMRVPVIYAKGFSPTEGHNFNKFLSGNFLVDGYEIFKNGERLSQRLYLARREWPQPQINEN